MSLPLARVLWLLAGGMLAFAAIDAVHTRVRLSGGLRATGVVVSVRTEKGYVRHSDHTGDTVVPNELRAATVRWTDDAGAVHSTETGPLAREFTGGETIPVVYDRDAPQAAMVLASDSPWDRPLSVAGLAAIFGFLGLGTYALGRMFAERR